MSILDKIKDLLPDKKKEEKSTKRSRVYCDGCGWEGTSDKAKNTEYGDYCPACGQSRLSYEI